MAGSHLIPGKGGPRAPTASARFLLSSRSAPAAAAMRLAKAVFEAQRSRPLPFVSVFQINLRLILVSGKTKEFLFSPNDSAADIAKHVYDNWPMGKPPPPQPPCCVGCFSR